MLEFIFAFIYRVVSGAQNGFGYANQVRGRVAATTIMAVLGAALLVTAALGNMPAALKGGAIALSLVGMAGAIAVEDSFNQDINIFPADIHLYETLTTGAITLALCLAGHNVLMVACSVYPGLIIHKGLINALPGNSWWDTRTNDPTGKTFDIPLLGISIPRGSNTWRISAAVASIIVAILSNQFGWGIWLYPLRIHL